MLNQPYLTEVSASVSSGVFVDFIEIPVDSHYIHHEKG